LRDKKPLFFLAENVAWILEPKHSQAFWTILKEFENIGYQVSYHLLNANDFWVSQDRKRVIIVWYRNDMWKKFIPPKENLYRPVLKDTIFALWEPLPAKEKNYWNNEKDLIIPNHEYMIGSFSTMFMSRNRVRSWNEPSFTIQAWWRHAPLHPQAPKMKLVGQNKRIFEPWKENLYRRLSVRECARIQTFPDDFIFKYKNVANGYKIIWNAVPVEFARQIAGVIYSDIYEYFKRKSKVELRFDIKGIFEEELVLA
jgi:DNA (cytosine-5)-methyltransferase 1